MNWGWVIAGITTGITACAALLQMGRNLEQIRELRERVKDLEAGREESNVSISQLRGDIRVLNTTIENLTKTIERWAPRS